MNQRLLLATKLQVPPIRAGLVPRPRLVERLNAGLSGPGGFGRKLALVSAPAGFGKTTLVTEWSGGLDCPCAWLALDAGDNDPARFFAYLLAALQGIDARIGLAAQPMLQAPQPPPPEAFLTSLINDIVATPVPFILVLDDYHLIDEPAIHRHLAFLLEHQLPAMHLVLVTRADPPLPLSRLRARDQMTEMRVDDLRFDLDEATAFLNQVMGLDLSADNAAALEERTEGWAVGLQMAALSLQGEEDAAAFVEDFSGSHYFVLDYLVDEVLNHQPEAVHSFLLQTSVLERLTGSLCDAVCASDADAGQAMLERFDRANLFVVPLDSGRRWYRYHHLFADLLRARLRQSSPDLVGPLNIRASRWYEGQGLASEAIHYALAGQDYDRAAALIEGNAMPAYQRGEMATLLKWIHALPDSVARRYPGVRIWLSWLLVSMGELENAEPLLADIEDQIQPADRSAQARSWRGGVAIVRAIGASKQGDVPRTVRQARLALEHLPQDNPLDRAHRITAGYLLGRGYARSGDLVRAERTFSDTVDLARAAQIPYSTAMNLSELARLHVIQGRLHRAADLYRECQRLAILPEGGVLPWMSLARIGLGRLMREWNDLEEAGRLFCEGIRYGERWNSPDTLVAGHTALAAVREVQGDLDAAAAELEEAAHIVQTTAVRPIVKSEWEAGQVRWRICRGDLAAARRWAAESELEPQDEAGFEQEVANISLARLLMAQRDYGAALDLLARLASGAREGGRAGRLIEILILQALALDAQGEPVQALGVMEETLALAEPEGYVRSFVDEGAPLAALLRQAAAPEGTSEYVRTLLAAFDAAERLASSPVESKTLAQGLIEPLSERELEILGFVAEGLTNRQIADWLHIALGTVKSHVHNIYGKMGVQNRTQAVARARELGLL